MSTRHDGRRRERSWERDDRDRDREKDRYPRGGRTRGHRDSGRRRDSRSRSPRRDRRDYDRDHRDHKSSRREDDVRDSRKDDKRPERRDDRREHTIRDKDNRDKDFGYERDHRQKVGRYDAERAPEKPSHTRTPPPGSSVDAGQPSSQRRPNLDPDAPSEDGEAMDATNADEEDMMAAMGLTGFGSTKGKHVEGNQEGNANVKKIRTWRQYMNRRGGFNRPLDKVK